MISVTVNGTARTFESEVTIPRVLELLDIDARRVAVAVNGEVVPRRQHRETVIHDGDAIEIVRMVGGGAPAPKVRIQPGQRATGRLAAHRTPRPVTRDPRSSTNTDGAEVVIAGGGIIGLAIAYELSRRGVECLVLDSRRRGMAATNAAAGILSPLSEFGRPDALVQLNLAGMRRYPEWVERMRDEAPEVDVEFMVNGVLRVAFDEDGLAGLRKGLRYQDELGIELIELDAEGVRDIEPKLNPDIVGGVLATQDGQISNQRFPLALARAAQQRGARVIDWRPVEGFRRRGGRVTTVRTPQADFDCSTLVLAAGPWTRPLAQKLGVDVPTKPIRGQMLALGRMVTPIGRPVWGSRGYVLPRANGLVFAGATVEDVGFRLRTTKRGLAQVRRAAFELVPQLSHAREHFSWAGLRPGTPDGLPMMGALPGYENVWVATGHFRSGILLGPITGELMADAILGGSSEALAPFDPARFAQ